MIKNWVYSTKKTDFRFVETGAGNDYGYVYAVRLNVTAKFSLLKIGATRMPYVRFYDFGRNANLFLLRTEISGKMKKSCMKCFLSAEYHRDPDVAYKQSFSI